MKRIIVIGSSGAGKTQLSRCLGSALGIEVIHFDKFYWGKDWTEPTKTEWKATLKRLLAPESWIIDGNYTGTLEMRLAACDTVIFLDIRRTLCTWRVIRRTLRYYRRGRPDMAVGCYERFDWPFLLFIWNYPKRTQPKIMALIDEYRDSTNVIHLRTPKAVSRFVRDVEGRASRFSTINIPAEN